MELIKLAGDMNHLMGSQEFKVHKLENCELIRKIYPFVLIIFLLDFLGSINNFLIRAKENLQ